jgi:Na+/phosphate symporter
LVLILLNTGKEINFMEQVKPWWQSRTIIASLVGTVFAVLSIAGQLPVDLTSSMVVDAIIGVTSVLAIVFRAKATTAIKPVLPTMNTSE